MSLRVVGKRLKRGLGLRGTSFGRGCPCGVGVGGFAGSDDDAGKVEGGF